ncbi:MAG: nicotinamide-nucleotide amidohydrolase family protein [Gammaproteobacteria bacterium]|nr:nicotinamide-nucleotide amidohydrolase family protein [Gammaproteobacteria bacterium]NNL99345.1 nicotinamide-nucleotide amidohydrolase family protein [Gammaproteobacteria bacterium]
MTVPIILTNTVERLAQLLTEREWMLATAESCTGGWVAEAVTSVPGSSAWFDRGFVSYSNAAKTEMLDVSAATIADYGAVSIETAAAMATGALAASHAHAALAVTGIAGPDGGTPDKPVGTVCFAWVRRGSAPLTQILQFNGNREAVRRQSVIAALNGLFAVLEG